jgi:hypothetical protein
VKDVRLPSDVSFSVLFFPNSTAEDAVTNARFFATYAPQIKILLCMNKSYQSTGNESKNDGYARSAIRPVFSDDFGYGRDYLNAFFMATSRSGLSMTVEIDLFGKRGLTYFSRFIACCGSIAAESAIITARFFATYAPHMQTLISMTRADRATGTDIDEVKNDGYTKTAISPGFPEKYLHFGYGRNYDNLPYMFKTNALFMASLRSGPSMTFEIDPFGKRGSTYFSRFNACLNPKVLRVSAAFDDSMTKVIDLKVYSPLDPNTELTGYSKESAATLLLHQSSFYAQNIHAVIHVSNRMCLTSSLCDCALNFPDVPLKITFYRPPFSAGVP